jgi:prepilin-type N-terminal cleavage/methylation domain-containing protein/prepilin-type processing-associated H-X9-DG protein
MSPSSKRAFTLIELLVVISILAVLAAILFPVFARAKEAAKKSNCLSNMRQIGVAFSLYLNDYDDRMPDRRDLKSSLPGGYRPWSSWPPSDPRAGWALSLLADDGYLDNAKIWNCPSVQNSTLGKVAQVAQPTTTGPEAPTSRYWMWRFDRPDYPVPLDNFWGKIPDQAVLVLDLAHNPQAGTPLGEADTELLVDPYFPRTIPSVSANLKGVATHMGGRNRLFLDLHVHYQRDIRLNP